MAVLRCEDKFPAYNPSVKYCVTASLNSTLLDVLREEYTQGTSVLDHVFRHPLICRGVKICSLYNSCISVVYVKLYLLELVPTGKGILPPRVFMFLTLMALKDLFLAITSQ